MRVLGWLTGLIVALAGISGCAQIEEIANKGDTSNVAPSVITEHIVWKTDQTIKPTAIILHWWGGWSGKNNIDRLVHDANNNISYYNPELKSTDHHPSVGHTSVQVGVTGDGKAYQLTSQLDSFARHAKCANSWAIGIEIEGSGPNSGHYIGSNQVQFDGVVATVRELQHKFNIPTESVVADDGRSGSGVLSHAMVDVKCRWADGKPAGSGKTDVDDAYLQRVIAALQATK